MTKERGELNGLDWNYSTSERRFKPEEKKIKLAHTSRQITGLSDASNESYKINKRWKAAGQMKI